MNVLEEKNEVSENMLNYMGQEKFRSTASKNSMENRLMEGKRRRGKPAKTWFVDWTKLDMADAFQLATDRERKCEIIIIVTAAQIAPPD